MEKTTYVAALLQSKCPKCREGKMFISSAANLRKFYLMNEFCPHCGVRLEPEPGFYQGAMYVSYGITVGCLIVISAILYYALGNPDQWVYISSVIAVMILLAPLNFRYSRVLYLYMFGGLKYKG